MSRYDHLKVYQQCYDLNLYFFKLSRGFAKDYKYGLAGDAKELLSALLDDIIIANSAVQKQPTLQRAILTVERLKIKARLLHDLKAMNLKSYEYFSRELVAISKQLTGWYDWSKKETKQAAT